MSCALKSLCAPFHDQDEQTSRLEIIKAHLRPLIAGRPGLVSDNTAVNCIFQTLGEVSHHKARGMLPVSSASHV